MKKFLLICLVSISCFVNADDFYNTPTIFKNLVNRSEDVRVYPNWADICILGNEQVTYTYYDNQSDEKYLNSCVLTYHYSVCQSGIISDRGCNDKKWKTMTDKKVIYTSLKNKSSCIVKKDKLIQKLKMLGFMCKGSGIN